MENIRKKISDSIQGIIKLIFVLVADLYLKNFVKFDAGSFQSTSVNDYILKTSGLKLNKQKINGSLLKNAKFKIADSRIGSIVVPFSGLTICNTLEINDIDIYLAEKDPDNPDGLYTRSVGESLILEANRLLNQEQRSQPKITVSTDFSEPFKEIKQIIQDLIDQFNINVNKLNIHLNNIIIVINSINANYSHGINFNKIYVVRDDNLTLLTIDKMVYIPSVECINIHSLIKNKRDTLPEANQNHDSFSNLLTSIKKMFGSLEKQYTVNIQNTLIYRCMEHNVLISCESVKATIKKNHVTTSISKLQISKDTATIIDASNIEITLLTNIDESKVSNQTEDLFIKGDRIYAGVVKPRGLKQKTVISNYIRKQIWPTIINVNINKLIADNSVDIVKTFKELVPNRVGNSNESNTASVGFRLQISVNNIDINNLYTEGADVTGICTSIYIDPAYVINTAKYLICTKHDINITDSIIIYNRNTNEIGATIEIIDFDVNKIIDSLSEVYPSFKKTNQQNDKKSVISSKIDYMINCKMMMVKIPCPWLTFSINDGELYNTDQIHFVTNKIVCNDAINFNTFRWSWGVTHEFTIDSILGTLRPKDLSDLFPREIQSKFKQEGMFSGITERTVDEYQLDTIQRLICKNNNLDKETEIKRLDLVQIIPDWGITNHSNENHLKAPFAKIHINTICLQFIQESGGPSCVTFDLESLRAEYIKPDRFCIVVPNLRIRDYVDGSVWSNIMSTRETSVTFVGGTLDISTPNKIYLNLDSRTIKFMNNYTKDTKIEPGKSSLVKRIFTTRLDFILSVKDTISLKNTKIKITPMRIEGPGLKEKIIMKLLSDNDKLAILLQGIKPLRPFVKIIHDGLLILNVKDSTTTTQERVQKFLHTSATEILEIGAAIGSIPESERKKISFYANQPLSTKEGFTEAGEQFVEGVQAIMDLIKQKSNAGLLDVPLIMIRPFTNSLSKVLLGILNEIDSERREIALNKY